MQQHLDRMIEDEHGPTPVYVKYPRVSKAMKDRIATMPDAELHQTLGDVANNPEHRRTAWCRDLTAEAKRRQPTES